MSRRVFVMLLVGAVIFPAVWPFVARAQQAIPRIGYLSPGSGAAGLSARDEAFLQGLRELGYVDGTNISLEYRFAEGDFDRLAGLAADLVESEVEVIVTVVTQASLAAKEATSTIPIVMVGVSDPVGSGLVASLSRPGENISGTSSMSSDIIGKSLDLLKEAVPTAHRVAVLWNPSNAVFQGQMLRQARVAARSLGVQLHPFGVSEPEEFDRTFAAMTADGADALLVLADPMFILHQAAVVDFARRNRLPAMYGVKVYAAAGGLMAFGPKMEDQFRRAASYVDKIVKGARPADLPVEQPTEFELIVNLKTAKALGLEIPMSLLSRANEVIE